VEAEGKTDAIDNVKSELFFIALKVLFFNPKAKKDKTTSLMSVFDS
jgi:hypothetical protein